jgi:hypothetical protein
LIRERAWQIDSIGRKSLNLVASRRPTRQGSEFLHAYDVSGGWKLNLAVSLPRIARNRGIRPYSHGFANLGR